MVQSNALRLRAILSKGPLGLSSHLGLLKFTAVFVLFQAKPFSWIPGAGMSIQIAVVGYEQVGLLPCDNDL